MNKSDYYERYGEIDFDEDLACQCPPTVSDCSECARQCPFEERSRRLYARMPDVFSNVFKAWGVTAPATSSFL